MITAPAYKQTHNHEFGVGDEVSGCNDQNLVYDHVQSLLTAMVRRVDVGQGLNLLYCSTKIATKPPIHLKTALITDNSPNCGDKI